MENSISEIKDGAGMLQRGDEKIVAVLVDYFQQLFSIVNPNRVKDFSKLEVETALKQMAPLKALGPEGMPPIFFQLY